MTINYSERNYQLEMLFSDFKVFMGSYDSKNNASPLRTPLSSTWIDRALKIEKFITLVLMNRQPLFAHGNQPTRLGKEFAKLDMCIDHKDVFEEFVLGREYSKISAILAGIVVQSFSEYVQVFFECIAHEIKKIHEDHYVFIVNSSGNTHKRLKADHHISRKENSAINEAIEKFRLKVKTPDVKKNINYKKYRAAKRYKSACVYLDQLFDEYTNLTFIAVDLTFPYATITTDEMQRFFTKLIRNGKNHQALKHRVGHLYKWEYNEAKGIYCRTIFIFPAASVIDILTQIEVIHNYWNDNITNGAGTVHNAKLSKAPKEFLSTCCTIEQNNIELVKQFKERVVFYLTHMDIYYQPKSLNEFKDVYNRGEFKGQVKEQALNTAVSEAKG